MERVWGSDSQPECRGTQGCREEASGVPPNVSFTVLFSVLSLTVLQMVFLPGKGAAKYFLVPKGAVNQKKLKNTGLGGP
jgi:hypothetical protein